MKVLRKNSKRSKAGSHGIQFDEGTISKLFGHEAAEDEDPKRLREYYFKVNAYDKVIGDFPLRILVGHKGIGKSALFKVAMAEDRDLGNVSIEIRPSEVVELGMNATSFLEAARSWEYGLSELIVQKVLEFFGVNRVFGEFSPGRDQVVDYLQDVLSRLRPGESIVDINTINKWVKNPIINVYIDDLDRGWKGAREDLERISALLSAVRDLGNRGRNPHLNFKVALRSDVYYLVRTSDESTDKIEGSVIWHTWTNHEIFVLLVKRIETFLGKSVDEQYLLHTPQRELSRYLEPVMEPRFAGRGHWENAPMYRVLMSLIRKRPRDLVKLCTLAARNAYDRRDSRLTTANFEAIFEQYSHGRLQDTINEYRSELRSIERLLMGMRPNRWERRTKQGYVYSTDELIKKIQKIIGGAPGEFEFANNRRATPKDLAAFMYKINFLTARKETAQGRIIRKYFEENQYLQSQFMDFGFDWEVHPAYRWALQPESVETIFYSLELSATEEQ